MTDIDPTAIDIDTDPTLRRFRGVTVHGNHKFDVPYVSAIQPELWMGGCEWGLVLPKHIDHVVSLYPWEAYDAEHDLKSNLVVRMYDSNDWPDLDQVFAIASWVNTCQESGTVLVHCQAGLNRSGLIVAAALILEGWDTKNAIDHLRTRRSPAVLCNQTFEKALHHFGQHYSVGA